MKVTACIVMDGIPQLRTLASDPEWLYILAVDKMEPYDATPGSGLTRPKGYCFRRRRVNVTVGGMTDRFTVYSDWVYFDRALAWLRGHMM